MGTVKFQTHMSGGNGNLQVTFDNVADVLTFDQNSDDPQEVDLPQGANGYTVTGAASPGPGGNIHLIITGEVDEVYPQDFGPGNIPDQSFAIFVTS
ncbi:MAG TPA: hypothetical protein VFE53_03205 [Mucilaginibacter sp.]|jgi:hypothetical protein|nr:hypothetical protein [Mucilaginibacter sp.]